MKTVYNLIIFFVLIITTSESPGGELSNELKFTLQREISVLVGCDVRGEIAPKPNMQNCNMLTSLEQFILSKRDPKSAWDIFQKTFVNEANSNGSSRKSNQVEIQLLQSAAAKAAGAVLDSEAITPNTDEEDIVQKIRLLHDGFVLVNLRFPNLTEMGIDQLETTAPLIPNIGEVFRLIAEKRAKETRLYYRLGLIRGKKGGS